jgi:hypothetical protein
MVEPKFLDQLGQVKKKWFLSIKSWLENFHNYFGYSPILIGSIFHHNIWVVKWTLSGHLYKFFL